MVNQFLTSHGGGIQPQQIKGLAPMTAKPSNRPKRWYCRVLHRLRAEALQAETAAELDALLPSILDKAFKGEL